MSHQAEFWSNEYQPNELQQTLQGSDLKTKADQGQKQIHEELGASSLPKPQ
jgi:hypothetical protein